MGSRVGLRGGLQIHYTGVRIPPHTPNWAISVTRLASELSKSGVGVRIPYCLPSMGNGNDVKNDIEEDSQADDEVGDGE